MKAVFLDRDGVINYDTAYVHDVANFKYIPGTKDALKRLAEAGYKLFIITNQSGIGRGYYTMEDTEKLHEYMLADFAKEGIKIEKIYICPHRTDENCECRKPNPYFVFKAQKEFDIDLSKSFFVGDRDTDIGCGKNAGVKTILVGDLGSGNIEPDFRKKDLGAAADGIVGTQHIV